MYAPELLFAHLCNLSPKIGAVSLRALKTHFGSFEAAWLAGDTAYVSCGLEDAARESLNEIRTRASIEKEREKLTRLNIWLMDESHEHYPPILREIAQPPALLYGRGKESAFSKIPAIAVVGTRTPTRYGLEACASITRELAASHVTIVSGLATGIDGAAHEAALAVDGTTVAILGSGIDEDSLFPSHHVGLGRRIVASGGAIISEFPPGTPGLKHHFPQRNRIVAGIALGVVVVEARERSGALITARMAIDENRDVFVVPGSIFSPTSVGPNLLMREGAIPVQCGRDILNACGIKYGNDHEASLATLDAESQSILAHLSEPLSTDELSLRAHVAIPLLISCLSSLELKGFIMCTEPGIYMRRTSAT